jgi:hypothetical protein
MHRRMPGTIVAAATLCATIPAGSQTGGQHPPRTWIDADTGHRIVRLTNEPGSASLYFNQNGYTVDGLKMVYATPEGISALDLATHAAKSVVTGQVRAIVTGRKRPNVCYTKGNAVYSARSNRSSSTSRPTRAR